MPGRNKIPVDSDPFGDDVVYAWVMTTRAQREAVMEDWHDGRKKYHKDISTLLFLKEDALLLACFLEFEHPCVCLPNGRPRETHYGKLLQLMLKHVDNLQKSVDNYVISVDKSVYSPVDKNPCYPQGNHSPQGYSSESMNLSTYPHFIHMPLVDKTD